MKTVETSNEESRDNAQTKLVEAKLRADFLHATMQRNEALQQAEEYKHRADLFKGDLDHYKEKSNKLQNSKAQVERELHSTRSILASMQGTVSNDVDFYKRKVRQNKFDLPMAQLNELIIPSLLLSLAKPTCV